MTGALLVVLVREQIINTAPCCGLFGLLQHVDAMTPTVFLKLSQRCFLPSLCTYGISMVQLSVSLVPTSGLCRAGPVYQSVVLRKH